MASDPKRSQKQTRATLHNLTPKHITLTLIKIHCDGHPIKNKPINNKEELLWRREIVFKTSVILLLPNTQTKRPWQKVPNAFYNAFQIPDPPAWDVINEPKWKDLEDIERGRGRNPTTFSPTMDKHMVHQLLFYKQNTQICQVPHSTLRWLRVRILSRDANKPNMNWILAYPYSVHLYSDI